MLIIEKDDWNWFCVLKMRQLTTYVLMDSMPQIVIFFSRNEQNEAHPDGLGCADRLCNAT